MSKQRCLFLLYFIFKDITSRKAKQQVSVVEVKSFTSLVFLQHLPPLLLLQVVWSYQDLQIPSLHCPITCVEYEQKGAPISSGLLRFAKGHRLIVLLDPSTLKDILSPHLATLL